MAPASDGVRGYNTGKRNGVTQTWREYRTWQVSTTRRSRPPSTATL